MCEKYDLTDTFLYIILTVQVIDNQRKWERVDVCYGIIKIYEIQMLTKLDFHVQYLLYHVSLLGVHRLTVFCFALHSLLQCLIK